MSKFSNRPFQAQRNKLEEAVAPPCLKCQEPVKVRGLRAGKYYLRRVNQGWLCYKCEEASTTDSVEKRRNAYLAAAYPNGPRAPPLRTANALRARFMPWIPEPVPELPVVNFNEFPADPELLQ